MSRRRGSRAAASSSRQLGAEDRRHRRANQISTQDQLGNSVERVKGRLETRAGSALIVNADGISLVPATAATDAVDTTDIVAKFNALLAALRAGNILET